jgi:hypothetical protein
MNVARLMAEILGKGRSAPTTDGLSTRHLQEGGKRANMYAKSKPSREIAGY